MTPLLDVLKAARAEASATAADRVTLEARRRLADEAERQHQLARLTLGLRNPAPLLTRTDR